MPKLHYETMYPDELAALRESVSLIYVPIGSTEYHGKHLPVGFDTLHAHRFALDLAARTGGVVLPPTFSGARGHEKWPGSVLLSEEAVGGLMADILRRLTAQGWRLIAFVSGHYPQVQGELLKRTAAEHVAQHPESKVIVVDPFTLHPDIPCNEHAGKVETSIALYILPELVRLEGLKQPDAFEGITPDCVDASPEFGKEYYDTVLDNGVQQVRCALAEIG